MDDKCLTGNQIYITSEMVKHMSIIYMTPKLIHRPNVALELVSILPQSKAKHINGNSSDPKDILKHESDIRLYDKMISVIHIECDLRKDGNDWKTIGDRLNKSGIYYTANYLFDCFCSCTSYYAKVYKLLDNRVVDWF